MTQDVQLCAVNTLLIVPALFGVMSVFAIYILAVPILIYKVIVSLLRRVFSSRSL